MQWVSSGLGGYLTGRLRTKWVGTHTHEVIFRDTAHGLVTWALATVIVTGAFAFVVSSGLGTGVHAATAAVSSLTQGVSSYGIDTLFRSARVNADSLNDAHAEATRIVANGLSADRIPVADRTYLVEMVVSRPGVSPAVAQQRVEELIRQSTLAAAKAKEAADTSRKAAPEASIYTALSMLIGALIAEAYRNAENCR